jgi:hypothetical protein
MSRERKAPFRTWWAAHSVRLHRAGVKHLDPGPPRRSLPASGSPVTSPARCRRALAWSAGAMEQVFLSDLFPGMIGFGRVHCVRYSLAVTGWHGFP